MAGILALLCAHPVQAQLSGRYLDAYLPDTVPGFDQSAGVTVLSRVRPLYEQPGIRTGSFIIRPNLDESFGYDSNVTGSKHGTGTPELITSPSVTVNSDWSRNSLGASLFLNDYRDFDLPNQSRTDVTVAVGGGYTIWRHDLTVAYAHQSAHETGTQIGSVPSTTPVPFDVDIFRANYTVDFGRVSLTPNLEYDIYSYGNTTVLNVPTSESYRNRDVTQGGVTAKYLLTDRTGAVVVLQAVNAYYTAPQAGQPSNNSNSGLILAGLDSDYDGVIRYRALAGLEVRAFEASQYKTRVAPIAELGLIWTPTGLTTVTGTLSRRIEDTSAEGSQGYTYLTSQLVVDHEYLRNVLLQGRVGYQRADFLQGGSSQTLYQVGAGATYLVNRNVRLSLNYDYSQQTSPNGATAFLPGGVQQTVSNGVTGVNGFYSGAYSRNVVLLTLHLGL